MRILFRFIANSEIRWIGYTEGKTWEQIFMAIDEFGDPYAADVIQLHRAVPLRFCVPIILDDENGWIPNDEASEISEYFWDSVPEVSDPRWEAKTKTQSAWKDYLKNRTGERNGD